MAKLSVSAAARLYDVSRPTLQKHLKNGKITAEKDAENHWRIDTSELNRVYKLRSSGAVESLPEALTIRDTPLISDMKAENERLRAELAVASALAEERGKRLDQLAPLLLTPPKRRWWPF